LVQETVKNIPLKNIIIETDAPYLTPIPYRGKEENEPLYTQYVLEKIIELRDESPEEITRTIFENSKSFFIKK
jgi:TatD DNase family protein